jgi:putative spermidine/putrescine transport system ATP-binding protein
VSGAAADTLVIDAPGRIELARGQAVGIDVALEGLIALA